MHAVISRNMFSFPHPPGALFFLFYAAHIVLVFGVRSVEQVEEITSLKNELNRRQSVCLPRLLLAFLPSIDKINFSFQHLYLERVVLWWRGGRDEKYNLIFHSKLNVVSLVPLAIPLWQHFAIIEQPSRREVFNLINI